MDDVGSEILKIAFPAALALAADPIASLIDTAFIGRLGLMIDSVLFYVVIGYLALTDFMENEIL